MRVIDAGDERQLRRLVASGREQPSVTAMAARIVRDVRVNGDAAVDRWRRRLDDAAGPIELSRREIERGWRRTPAGVRRALRLAASQLERVSAAQLPRAAVVTPIAGVRIEQRVTPFERVGCYVPAGRYPLPSSLLMTAVPARVAGVRDICVATPRTADVVLAAAVEAGAHRVFRVGGAQAVAAMAFGTRRIPRADKICGPGNAWVTAAKRLVAAAGACAIDMTAGPTELVICSHAGDPQWIAADLAAQAEHDPAARVIFVTTNRALGRSVVACARRDWRRSASRPALARGVVVLARSADDAVRVVNRIAPEHVVCDTAAEARAIVSAGTVFVGRWSAQAAGDYTTGSNHVLPTAGAARWRGGLSAADFVRVSTIQTLTRAGIRAIGPAAATLATAEHLHAHAASIQLRCAP